MKKQMIREEARALPPRKEKADRLPAAKEHHPAGEQSAVAGLHRNIGNQAVQRLIAQREGQEPTALDQETAGRIDRARSGGQPLETSVQAEMSQAIGADLSGVRVHTSSESDKLNQDLGAKAFTTGQDVFFRDGAYAPHSSDGQKLIAHELAHVVQQGSGAVSSSGPGLEVNAPGDTYEREADATADAVMSANTNSASVQMQEVPEEEEALQMQAEEEEELVQAQEEEEELVQAQEEEEELVQAQAEEEEEEMQP